MKKLHSGFTIAELLLSMLVVMVLAAALVPVIGPKKIKLPNVNKSHGVFECYWNESGSALMQYHANNRGRKDAAVDSVAGDHCVFQVPAADKYDIFAIGAGSDGYPAGIDVNDPPPDLEIGFSVTADGEPSTGFLTANNLRASIGNVHISNAPPNMGPTADQIIQNEIRDMLEDWAESLRNPADPTQRTDLYIGINNVQSPVGKGGDALATRIVMGSSNNGEINCPVVCAQNLQTCHGPYDEGVIHLYSDYNQMIEQASQSGMCFFYLHETGSDSERGLGLSPDDVIYFPIDGLTSGGESFTITRNQNEVAITSNSMRPNGELKTATLTLWKRKDGEDAYNDNGLKPGRTIKQRFYNNEYPSDGNDGFENEGGIAVIRKNGGAPVPLTLNDFTHDNGRINLGAVMGVQVGRGSSRQGSSATLGRADYNPRPFRWTFSSLNVHYRYGKAGTPGDIQLMTYNNLRGKLYLYPGRINPATGDVNDTVVTKLEDGGEDEDAYILSAKSSNNPGTPDEINALLVADDMPRPPRDIIQSTIPNNSRFDAYISKIRATGFRDGLFSCNQGNAPSCPGYAGRGAYPFVFVNNAPSTLRIEDVQDLTAGMNPGRNSRRPAVEGVARNVAGGGRSVTRRYFATAAQDADSCGQDPRYPNNVLLPFALGNPVNMNIDGTNINYQPRACFGSPARRRDGAVVIVW